MNPTEAFSYLVNIQDGGKGGSQENNALIN